MRKDACRGLSKSFAFLRNCPLPQPKPRKRLLEQIVARGQLVENSSVQP